MHDHRRAAVVEFAHDVGPQLPQDIEQVFQRPLPHARRAVEAVRSVAQANHRGQEPHGSAAAGHIEIGLQNRRMAVAAVDANRSADGIVMDFDAQFAQGVDHDPRVFALELPRSVESPSASAAQTKARLVMLFDPGGQTVA